VYCFVVENLFVCIVEIESQCLKAGKMRWYDDQVELDDKMPARSSSSTWKNYSDASMSFEKRSNEVKAMDGMTHKLNSDGTMTAGTHLYLVGKWLLNSLFFPPVTWN